MPRCLLDSLTVVLQRDGDFPAVVCAEAGLEAGGEEVAAALGERPESAAQNWAGSLAVEPGAIAFGADANADDFDAGRTGTLIALEFLVAHAGTGRDEDLAERLLTFLAEIGFERVGQQVVGLVFIEAILPVLG